MMWEWMITCFHVISVIAEAIRIKIEQVLHTFAKQLNYEVMCRDAWPKPHEPRSHVIWGNVSRRMTQNTYNIIHMVMRRDTWPLTTYKMIHVVMRRDAWPINTYNMTHVIMRRDALPTWNTKHLINNNIYR